ncbi:G3E family GTPase [Paenibacillus phyllosphaerae]|uniref:G3E family GTPase n=1 Tax=Paenibacillus phyllosphaerae TaxID=274593 RepID=A0A7W5FPC2_9BACL|nr:CobW family GTP-binding protein [Paenibacillus phyllosphaerae]MBB3112093.1 G3E family GTPase [Paenibacillus phyllosphaerae]
MTDIVPIPIVVVSGFLGSGKTTLLLRMLKHAKAEGLRASVLMNEVGSADVDGVMISSETASAMLARVTEGCLCCTKKSELSGCLMQLAEAQPDLILIELTGIANPEEIVEAMSEPELQDKVMLHRIVTVLDAEHAIDYNSIFATDRELVHTLRRQIEVADVVLANKADLISSKTAAKLDKMVRDRNGVCSLVLTVRCDVKPSLVLEGVTVRSNASGIGTHYAPPVRVNAKPAGVVRSSSPAPAYSMSGTGVSSSAGSPPKSAFAKLPVIQTQRQSYSRVKTVTIYPGTACPVSRRTFEAFFSGRGNACLRAKGFMPFGPGGALMLFQMAGKRIEWQPTDYTGEPYFVMIGIDLDHARINNEWEKLTRH